MALTQHLTVAEPAAVAKVGSARVGCSGWSYADWRGIVYPAGLPQRLWFQHYTTLFDTVELNNTFYRLPTEQAVSKWAAAAPANFVYAVKLGQFGTHRMKLKDPESWLAKHFERISHLAGTHGPTLVQLPPRWKRNIERLDEFLTAIPHAQRWAVEIRDRSWLHDDVLSLLSKHGAALCIHDLLEDHPFELTTNWTYVRFHGPNAIAHPYRGAYGSTGLRRWIEALHRTLDAGNDAYCYFNNDYDGHAVTDAQLLRAALGGEPPPTPPERAAPV